MIAAAIGLAMVLAVGILFHRQIHRWVVWGNPRLFHGSVEEVIRWLPAETEMLSACKDYVIPSEELLRDDPELFLKELQRFTAGAGLWNEGLKPETSLRVRFAVEGSCAFRSPTSLGLMLYSGCHIVVFDGELGEEGDRILNRISARAKRFLRMSGIRVAVLEEKFESDLWKLHVAFPNANVLVAATEETFLSKVLARRIDGSSRAALPEHLPEWRDVDRSAPFWAVRHYIPSVATLDHSSPYHPHSQVFTDPGAIGVGVTVTAERLHLVYLTTTLGADSLLQKIWSIPTVGFQSTVRSLRPQVFEVVRRLDSAAADSMGQLVLLLMLGHGIYL